jgi:TldD protein
MLATSTARGRPGRRHTDPDVHALAMAALDAATAAGASYADVRFVTRDTESFSYIDDHTASNPMRGFAVGVGVRALVRGYWGVAASPTWTTDEVVRLARQATHEATTGALGAPRDVTLAHTDVARGDWTVPNAIDPFDVSVEEKLDFMMAMCDGAVRMQRGLTANAALGLARERRIMASTEGSFLTQTLFETAGRFAVSFYEPDWRTGRTSNRFGDFLRVAGQGWEYIRHAPYETEIPRLIDEADRLRRPKPVDIGRYDVVLDAYAMADLLDVTIGAATELDRVAGYDANEGGTSYVVNPLAALGTLTMASPIVTVRANRSLPGGAATVGWDDDGVAADDWSLVTNGVLTDLQTTRESANWLSPWYTRRGVPVRSHGCARSEFPLDRYTHTPANLVLNPAAQNTTFDDLVAGIDRGYAILGGSVSTDYQCLNGVGMGAVTYEIRNGKLGSAVEDASYVFRAPELWKSVAALGGPTSAKTVGSTRGKLPTSRAPHSLVAVPARIPQLSIVDAVRRA